MSSIYINDLLEPIGYMPVGSLNVEASGIEYRSDRVRKGDLFFCIPGFKYDGHDFAAHAVEQGAAALVTQRALDIDVPQFVVDSTRQALAHAAAVFYQHPSKDVLVAGITGTNGKTTTTYLLDSILRAAGQVTGIVGTVETRVADVSRGASRTTPESADMQKLLAEMRSVGVGACSVEVSSHAIELRRVDAISFAVVALTNLTQDHLDFHHTMAEYAAVKRRLFMDFDCKARVMNVDDPFGRVIAEEIGEVLTVGRAADAAVRAVDEELRADGATFTLVTPQGRTRIDLPLAGAFNVSNALVAAGCAIGMGIDLDTITSGLNAAPQVPGRLERIECGQAFSVVVDYAHTPDSLEKAITAVREVTAGRVIVVFGCGGDRDPDKRPVMGRAAGDSADHSIVTSDNPRTEDPVGIILQVEDGLRDTGGSYEVVVDRRHAIETALEQAQPGDAVLIAGKGHEDYQEFSDRRIHFDDREVAREVLGQC